MNTNLPPVQQTTVVRFLNIDPKPSRRRIRATLDEDKYEAVMQVAEYEGLEFSEALNRLLEISLRYYEYKRGTLNEAKPENAKTFHCQICGEETSLRRRHRLQILNEEYLSCEDCFFADKHKAFIVMLMDRE
jgi:hypothetical protein